MRRAVCGAVRFVRRLARRRLQVEHMNPNALYAGYVHHHSHSCAARVRLVCGTVLTGVRAVD